MERHVGLLNWLFETFRRFFFMPHLRKYSISVINKVEFYYGIYVYFHCLKTCVFFHLVFLGFTGKVCEDIMNTRRCSTFLDMLKGFFYFPFPKHDHINKAVCPRFAVLLIDTYFAYPISRIFQQFRKIEF